MGQEYSLSQRHLGEDISGVSYKLLLDSKQTPPGTPSKRAFKEKENSKCVPDIWNYIFLETNIWSMSLTCVDRVNISSMNVINTVQA